MAAPGTKQFAVDLNFVLDLADGADFAWKLLEARKNKGYSFELPPTAAIELNLISRTFDHPANKLAGTALQNLLSWEIHPYDLKGVGHGITDLFARTLI